MLDRSACGNSAIRDTVRRKIGDDTCVILNMRSHPKFIARLKSIPEKFGQRDK